MRRAATTTIEMPVPRRATMLSLGCRAALRGATTVRFAMAAVMILGKAWKGKKHNEGGRNKQFLHIACPENGWVVTGVFSLSSLCCAATLYGRRMKEFSIRAAAPADCAAIVALLRELADYEKLLDRFSLTEEQVARDMLGQACHTDLAFAGQEAAGIATWFWTYNSFRPARALYVEDLYVRPDFRGRGLGRQLLAKLAARAREASGYLQWQVLDWNAPSIAFYKSLGAVMMPEWISVRLQGEALEQFLAPEKKP